MASGLRLPFKSSTYSTSSGVTLASHVPSLSLSFLLTELL